MLNKQNYSINPLIDYFEQFLKLSDKEKQLVESLFKARLYRKKQFVLQEGDLCNHMNFVLRGCLRMYKIDEKGVIHIIQFPVKDWWSVDIGSFHGRKASMLNIDALEDTIVFQISYEDLINLYTVAPVFDRIFRVLMENSYVSLQNRLLQMISSTADERYESFLENYPELANRLSQVQISAYLGITPEFLSRLRNKRVRS